MSARRRAREIGRGSRGVNSPGRRGQHRGAPVPRPLRAQRVPLYACPMSLVRSARTPDADAATLAVRAHRVFEGPMATTVLIRRPVSRSHEARPPPTNRRFFCAPRVSDTICPGKELYPMPTVSPLAPAAFPTLPPIPACAWPPRGRDPLQRAQRPDAGRTGAGQHVAGVFTRSLTAGPPVVWCREALPRRQGARRSSSIPATPTSSPAAPARRRS